MPLTALPTPDTPRLRCPACHHATELRGGVTVATPLGVRRTRRCAHCGGTYRTLECVCTPYMSGVLNVPALTPRWALRVAGWVCRVAARGCE